MRQNIKVSTSKELLQRWLAFLRSRLSLWWLWFLRQNFKVSNSKKVFQSWLAFLWVGCHWDGCDFCLVFVCFQPERKECLRERVTVIQPAQCPQLTKYSHRNYSWIGHNGIHRQNPMTKGPDCVDSIGLISCWENQPLVWFNERFGAKNHIKCIY